MSSLSPRFDGDSAAPAAWRREWDQRWKGLAPRERLALLVVAWVLSLLLLWLVGVQPALRTLREAPAQIDAVDSQLQAMDSQLQES